MKVMVLVKADAETEGGRLPSEAELRAMGDYNERLVEAGVMLAGEGLHPSAHGRRVRFDGDHRHTVTDGPGAELEIRPVMGMEDFGEAFTPELRTQEERLRELTGVQA